VELKSEGKLEPGVLELDPNVFDMAGMLLVLMYNILFILFLILFLFIFIYVFDIAGAYVKCSFNVRLHTFIIYTILNITKNV
jgi:uncharacterized membrane protein YqjE